MSEGIKGKGCSYIGVLYRRELHEWEGVQEWRWPKVAAQLPTRKKTPFLKARRMGGRPQADDRLAFSAILWRVRCGGHWRKLPKRFGSSATARRRLARWACSMNLERAWRAYLEQLTRRELDEWGACLASEEFRKMPLWLYFLERIHHYEFSRRYQEESTGPVGLKVSR